MFTTTKPASGNVERKLSLTPFQHEISHRGLENRMTLRSELCLKGRARIWSAGASRSDDFYFTKSSCPVAWTKCRLQLGGLWVSGIQSWSPAAGLKGWQSPPSAGGRAAGIHLGQVEGFRNVGGELPAPARGAASGSREHKGGERKWPWLRQATCRCSWRARFLDSAASRKISGRILLGWQAGWGTHHRGTRGASVSQDFPGQLWWVCASASVQTLKSFLGPSLWRVSGLAKEGTQILYSLWEAV